VGIRTSNLLIRVQKAGIRHTFNLNTANQDKAARKAIQINASLIAVGWPETLARFGVEKPSKTISARTVTLGQYVAAAEAVFDRKPQSFRLYAGRGTVSSPRLFSGTGFLRSSIIGERLVIDNRLDHFADVRSQ